MPLKTLDTVLNIFHTAAAGDLCPMMTKIPCPAMRLAKYGGDVIQLVHKYLPPDHVLAKRPEIASRKTNLICEEPGMV